MLESRIRPLADGEELIWFEGDDCTMRSLLDDPRQELLEHRRASESALERDTTIELSTARLPKRGSAARSSAPHILHPGNEAHLIMVLRDPSPLSSDQENVQNRCFTPSSRP